MSIPRGNRTCITHGERRPISCLDAFGPRPCKYKCKRHDPCDAGKLPQSLKRRPACNKLKQHTVLHGLTRRPSKRWKRGVLQPLYERGSGSREGNSASEATPPLDTVVAAVAQATSPLDTEVDSDAELALQIEEILADPAGTENRGCSSSGVRVVPHDTVVDCMNVARRQKQNDSTT